MEDKIGMGACSWGAEGRDYFFIILFQTYVLIMAQSGDGNGKLQLEWVRQEEEMIFISDINYVLIVA